MSLPGQIVEVAGRGAFHVVSAGPAESAAPGAAPGLLVHGLGGDAALWRHVLPLLAKDRPVFAYDLRGHGTTRAGADGDFSLAAHTADLIALSEVLSPDERPHVLGTSLGGVIAQVAATSTPATPGPSPFASLVLACTWAAAPAGLDADALADAIATTPDIRAHFGGIVRAMLPDHPDDAFALVEAIAAADRAALAQGARELFSYSGLDRLGAIAVPTLALSGDRDETFPAEAAMAIAAGIAGARSGVVARAGHAPYIERPGLFAHIVGEFWREVDTAVAG